MGFVTDGGAEAGRQLGYYAVRELHLGIEGNIHAGFTEDLPRPHLFRQTGQADGQAVGVNAGVPHRTAAHRRIQAKVPIAFRRQIEAHPTGDKLEVAQPAFRNHLFYLEHLGMIQVHKGFKHGDIVGAGRRLNSIHLLHCGNEWFFAQNVFACFSSFDRPLAVQAVG